MNIRGGAVADYVANFDIYKEWNPGVGLWTGFWMIIQYAWNSMNIPGLVCSVAQPLKSKKDVNRALDPWPAYGRPALHRHEHHHDRLCP